MSGSWVDTARGLQDIVRAGRRQAEEGRRMAPGVLQAVGDAGLFAAFAPTDVGGSGCTLRELFEAIEIIAEADPTVAWHVANSGIAGLFAARLSPAHRGTLYGRRDRPFGNAAVPAGRATPTEGGFRLTGNWPFVTGALDCAWIALGGVVEEPGSTTGLLDGRVFLAPVEQVELVRSFDEATSTRGTGSHGCRCSDLFVPEHFAVSWAAPLSVDEPLYRLPRATSFVAAIGMVQLGVLRFALDSTVDAIAGRVSRGAGSRHVDWPRVQVTIARAAAVHHSLRHGMFAAADALWAEATDGAQAIRPISKALVYATALEAIDSGRQHVSELSSISTSSAFVSQTDADRAMRDAHAISAGAEIVRFLHYASGQVLAGHEPTVPGF